MSTPPSTAPASALAVKSDFTTIAISVLLNPHVHHERREELVGERVPGLEQQHERSSVSALGVPSNSFSGSTTDSRSELGW